MPCPSLRIEVCAILADTARRVPTGVHNKININLTYRMDVKMNFTKQQKFKLREQKFYDNSNLYSGLKNIAILFVLSYNKLEWYFE